MGATHYSKEVRREVLHMGALGKTYPEIQEKFPVPKSTLSYWFKNAGKKPDRTRQLEHLKKARVLAVETIHKHKEERLTLATNSAKKELALLPLKNKSMRKALLAMLYWAEGAKAQMRFVNTDPMLAKLYLTLLRSSYSLDESKIRVRLHLHYYHKHRESIAFWSKLLEVPESQFGKIYVKKRSVLKRFRKNFQGICSIGYSGSSILRELLSLGRQIAQKYGE